MAEQTKRESPGHDTIAKERHIHTFALLGWDRKKPDHRALFHSKRDLPIDKEPHREQLLDHRIGVPNFCGALGIFGVCEAQTKMKKNCV